MEDWINNNGNIFSFIGLIFTMLTFIGVICNKNEIKKLNKKNFKINRMPENFEDLKTISELLSDYLVDFSNKKKEIKTQIAKISPILKSLLKSLNSDETENLTILKKSIKKVDNWMYEGEKIGWFKKTFFKKEIMTEFLVNEIDIKLTRLITDIDNIDKDNKKNIL